MLELFRRILEDHSKYWIQYKASLYHLPALQCGHSGGDGVQVTGSAEEMLLTSEAQLREEMAMKVSGGATILCVNVLS